jgi:hypothetical protein
MEKKLAPIKPVPTQPEKAIDRSDLAKRVGLERDKAALARSSAAAQRQEVPATLLKLESRPLSAYDDNPVLDEAGAAFIVGVSADCLKKWRQRKQGPDYLQYGKNGPVRYKLKALLEFRDLHRVRFR